MSCSIRLRVAGDLVHLAKVMRVLSRHRVAQSRVSLMRQGNAEFAAVLATLKDARRSRRLATELARMPSVLEAVISGDDDFLVAHYFAQPSRQSS